ncbi:MAG: nucleoside triphosphate pyrophosphohydrolase [Flavobacteriales bacterium]
MKTNRKQAQEAFVRLLDIMDDLREKCPWDQKQTNESLSHLSIEECFELVEALRENNPEEIKKELGDLFLHLVFYSKIGEENNQFTVTEVLNSICEKLIYRHPHIYGDTKVKDEKEVLENWEKLKLKEKGSQNSVLSGVPKALPALTKAYRIQSKVKGVGFDWDDMADVKAKVFEEWEELQTEIEAEHQANIESELGDVFFALINYARHLGINPEQALAKTNSKFIQRFQSMETEIKTQNLDITAMTLEEMDVFWALAKLKEKY